ncbi:SH3 domain-containing protein 19-like isoform X2 [Betta splendens]|uniref:SH3 domain-containing protein 19-like isoform X2 n=1 Tax=Betta splendens TaxID=158456 RepID=A0A9W2Y5T9_BETSP|nr:SH3 domain-containing protein 19-like isoform X2 [Betta splendens]
MAEARSEEEEENMMRDTREQVVRRPPNRDRPDRRKPEQRHSQGPLSSIRAVIKRTSNRSTSQSETSRDRDRERERERDRDRRRPEITILSAEPLPSTAWFPGASAGIPPPPPPAAQIWGATIPPAIQPPPSYEEVIKEKRQEQASLPSLAPSSSSSHPGSTITIATQTDPGSDPGRLNSQVGRPVRPSRPPLPCPPRSSHVDNNSSIASQLTLTPSDTNSVVPDTPLETVTNPSAHTQCCDPLNDLCLPLTSKCAQTEQLAPVCVEAPSTTSSDVVLERPRPRPRSKLGIQRMSNEVKVQTLVKLREDGLATLAARAAGDTTNQEANQGKYLHELLEAFSSDDWGFPEQHSDGSENSQSESEEDEEDMAALKARIQAFEQQQQQPVADGNSDKELSVTKRPEPRPRPRLHPTKSAPPSIAPKPQTFSPTPKPSSQVWEDRALTSDPGVTETLKTTETAYIGVDPAAETSASSALKEATAPVPEPGKSNEKPAVAPKPQSVETIPSSSPAPVPAPRPPPPKLTPTSSTVNPKPPPRPTVAPRVSVGSPHQDKGAAAEQPGPTLPPRPSMEVSRGGSNEVQDKATSTAPALSPKPTGAPPAPPDPNPVPNKPAAFAQVTASKPSGPVVALDPGIKPVTPACGPAPALRKGPVIQTKPEATNPVNATEPPLPPRPSSGKFLPLRPPPIKSIPGRPPPPAFNSTSSPVCPASKGSPPTSTSPASQPSQTRSSSPSSTKQNQKAPKKGPPLPPRPKPGHPLYTSYAKQEVLIVLDDPTLEPSEQTSDEGKSQSTVTPLISQSQCLLDLDIQPVPLPSPDSPSKPALEDLNLSDSQSILPVDSAEQKEQPDCPTVSGPRCEALFDYEGEEDDELTFSQGDVIALLEHISEEWGRGEIHGQIGIFPLNFTKVVERLPQPVSSPEETTESTSASTELVEGSAPKTMEQPVSETEEWVVALFDFTGQTTEDLSFHKGAVIHVLEHIDAEWRRGRLEGREGLYPVAFTQPCSVQPVPHQQPLGMAKALFDFTAESDDELTLKVGDIITQVEPMDEQWVLGAVGGKHGIIPKSYISLL